MNWTDLLAAFALYLVLEGILPFLSPRGFSHTMRRLAQMPENRLRRMGFGSMLAGVLLLYFVRS